MERGAAPSRVRLHVRGDCDVGLRQGDCCPGGGAEESGGADGLRHAGEG